MAGIYIHVPYCKKACHYCNFYFTTSKNKQSEFIDYVKKEWTLRKQELVDEEINTIYFGGGTPSVLPIYDIESLIQEIYDTTKVSEDVEITLEANPDDLNQTYINQLKHASINRFSVGVQSFYSHELEWMNRAHNEEEAMNCLKLLKESGYDNFSVDLIYGIPSASSKSWENNLKILLEYQAKHISCYALTVEKRTALEHMINEGKTLAPVDEHVVNQFYIAHDYLSSSGYEHYEISNYATQGYRSKHNSSYWEGTKYIGLGPGAHSFSKNSRRWNVSSINKYCQGIEKNEIFYERETLTLRDQYNEWCMTGIRRIEGLTCSELELRFSEYADHFYQCLKEIPDQYLIKNNKNITLSREGLVYADFVGSHLFAV